MPALAALLALSLAVPFLAGLAHLGMADWHGADWRGLGAASLVSALSATTATLLVALGGIPLGYLLARRQGRRVALLGFVVQMPLALPPLSSGILLLFLLGYASPIGALTHGALTDSFAGIVIAEGFVAAPFLIIAARSAFAAVDPVLEDVARSLGHPPLSVLLRASLPLAWRGIAAGMLLCWLRAFGEFGATVMVAYHPYSLPVYTYVAFGAEGLPAMVPVLLPTLGTALLVMLAATRLTAPRRLVQAMPSPAATPPAPAWAAPAAEAPAPPLTFAVARHLPGFTLSIAHRSEVRRIALLGASGSGKSLTLRAIAGLDRGLADRLTLGTRDLSALPPEARHIAYVPQSYGLFPHLTAARQIAFARDHDAEAARFWFTRLGLAGLESRRPAELSLGQQQRVALARALITRPQALLLDEPLSALDPFLKIRMRAELKSLQTSLGMTFVHVTHSQDEAMALADLIVVMNDGRIEQAANPRTVFERPATAFVAQFMGNHNVISGRVVERTGDITIIEVNGGGRFTAFGSPTHDEPHADFALRTDHIRLAPADEPGFGFTAVVQNVEDLGASVKLSVAGAGVEDFTVVLRDADYYRNPVKAGDAVPLSWATNDAIILGRVAK